MKSKLRNRIQQLNRMDVENTEYTYINSVVKDMHLNFKTLALQLEPGAGFYRVRVNPLNKPSNIIDLREPPWDLVTDYQRCNPPGVPMFYAANRRGTAVLECDVKTGDLLYISQWSLDKLLTFNSTLSPDIYDQFPNITAGLDSSNEALFSFFETVFTRPIHEKFSDQYKLTSAIAQFITSNFSPSKNHAHTFSKNNHCGINYPSVADIGNGYNVALHPEIVDDFFSLHNVMEARVISRNGKKLSLEIIDNSNEFKNNRICWSGDPQAFHFRSTVTKSSQEFHGVSWILPANPTTQETDLA